MSRQINQKRKQLNSHYLSYVECDVLDSCTVQNKGKTIYQVIQATQSIVSTIDCFILSKSFIVSSMIKFKKILNAQAPLEYREYILFAFNIFLITNIRLKHTAVQGYTVCISALGRDGESSISSPS